MRPDVLLLVLPPVFVLVCWLIRPAWCGWGWDLTEGECHRHGLSAGRSDSVLGSPSVSSWPDLPAGWTPADVEMVLMEIEYAEAYRG